MPSTARIIGSLSLAGAAWSVLAAGAAHFDALLLSGAFLFGASMIAEATRRPKIACLTLELAARLAALGAEHDALAARPKTMEAGPEHEVAASVRDLSDVPAEKVSRPLIIGAGTRSGRDNVVRLFADMPHAKPK